MAPADHGWQDSMDAVEDAEHIGFDQCIADVIGFELASGRCPGGDTSVCEKEIDWCGMIESRDPGRQLRAGTDIDDCCFDI